MTTSSTRRGRPPKAPGDIFWTSKERFWRCTDTSGGPKACWPYSGHKLRLPGGRMVSARRFSYILLTGNDPMGWAVQQGCASKNCVNWDHVNLEFTGPPQAPIPITTPHVPGPEPLPSDAELLAEPEWKLLHWKERLRMIDIHNKLYTDDQRDPDLHVTEAERLYA